MAAIVNKTWGTWEGEFFSVPISSLFSKFCRVGKDVFAEISGLWKEAKLTSWFADLFVFSFNFSCLLKSTYNESVHCLSNLEISLQVIKTSSVHLKLYLLSIDDFTQTHFYIGCLAAKDCDSNSFVNMSVYGGGSQRQMSLRQREINVTLVALTCFHRDHHTPSITSANQRPGDWTLMKSCHDNTET